MSFFQFGPRGKEEPVARSFTPPRGGCSNSCITQFMGSWREQVVYPGCEFIAGRGLGGTGKARRFPSAHRRSPALYFRSRSRRAPGRRSPRGAAGVLGPGLPLRVRWSRLQSRGALSAPRACAVKPRRRPALEHSARDRPASPAGLGAPSLPLRARGAGGRARQLVPPASQSTGCSRSRSTREAALDESGKGRNVLRGTHQSKLLNLY